MKGLLVEFFMFVMFVIVVAMFVQVFVIPKINGGTVIIQPTYSVQIIQPTQQPQVAIEPTWTPFFVQPTAAPTPIPAELPSNPNHIRSDGVGDVGSHNPGRTDRRTP